MVQSIDNGVKESTLSKALKSQAIMGRNQIQEGLNPERKNNVQALLNQPGKNEAHLKRVHNSTPPHGTPSPVQQPLQNTPANGTPIPNQQSSSQTQSQDQVAKDAMAFLQQIQKEISEAISDISNPEASQSAAAPQMPSSGMPQSTSRPMMPRKGPMSFSKSPFGSRYAKGGIRGAAESGVSQRTLGLAKQLGVADAPDLRTLERADRQLGNAKVKASPGMGGNGPGRISLSPAEIKAIKQGGKATARQILAKKAQAMGADPSKNNEVLGKLTGQQIKSGHEKNSVSGYALDKMADQLVSAANSYKAPQSKTKQTAKPQQVKQAPQSRPNAPNARTTPKRPENFKPMGFDNSASAAPGTNVATPQENTGAQSAAVNPETSKKSFAQMASEISFPSKPPAEGITPQETTPPGEEPSFPGIPDPKWPGEGLKFPNKPNAPFPSEGLKFKDPHGPLETITPDWPELDTPGVGEGPGLTFDLTSFGPAAGEISALISPLVFDLNGMGLGLSKEAKLIPIDLDGDEKFEMITDLDTNHGLLVFDSKQTNRGELTGEDMFGDNTDLSHYGITADTHDGNFKNGFDALRALCEHMKLVDDTKQFLDASDLALLEEKIGLRMRIGGFVNGEQRHFHELGINQINLGNPNQTQHVEEAPKDKWGNKIIMQDGATFEIHGTTRKYADIWFQIQARVKESDNTQQMSA